MQVSGGARRRRAVALSRCGIALHEAHTALERRTAEREAAYLATLEALAAAVDARDHSTYGHSRRVAEMAAALAQELGLPQAAVQTVRRGGLLHDLGKIGLEDRVLRKAGPLDEAEWAQMRLHPVLGCRILGPLDFLAGIHPLVLHHHERYDGSGYPSGLRGEEIPRGARILSVADAFDAMTSERAYRPPRAAAASVEEIVRLAGRQFDPAVAAALRRIWEGGRLPHGLAAEAPCYDCTERLLHLARQLVAVRGA